MIPRVFSFVCVVVSVASLWVGCADSRKQKSGADSAPSTPSQSSETSGTEEMVAMLAKMARQADGRKNLYLNDRRVELLRSDLTNSLPLHRHMELRMKLAEELLAAGRTQEALEQCERVESILKKRGLLEANQTKLALSKALCWLRLGEQENCLINHNVDSCLFPIQNGGVHVKEQGSRNALQLFEQYLQVHPNNPSARWLLNIAWMTLGGYPDRVPEKWLISPEQIRSDRDFPRFYDVAGPLGLDVNGNAGGSVVEDFDGDGLLDVMASSYGLTDPLRLFRNQGDGSFQEITESAGLNGLYGGLNMISGDYNNDGHVDVLILRGGWFGEGGLHPNSLLQNQGNGRFEDVTRKAGLLSFHPTQTATFLDFDLDGRLDLYVGNESGAGFPHPCELYHNNGDGTFTEVAKASGVDYRGFVKGVVAGDYNNDGWPDLYVSVLGGPNCLYRNEGFETEAGEWSFTEIAREAGVAEPVKSFPTWFWDYNNDGWLDLWVAGYGIRSVGVVALDYMGKEHDGVRLHVYKNLGDGTFENVSKQLNLFKVVYAMGCNFGDLNNDGWLDFFAGTGDPDLATLIPNRVFVGVQGEKFEEITSKGGFGNLQKGHGVSFADIDNDGDQDVYTVLGGAYTGDVYWNALYANPGWNNAWVTLELEGTESNRRALGARIRLDVETADGMVREIHRVVGSGGSFGASPLRQEIGLGDARRIVRVVVRWPVQNGKEVVYENVPMNTFLELKENGTQEVKGYSTFQLPKPGEGKAHQHRHSL